LSSISLIEMQRSLVSFVVAALLLSNILALFAMQTVYSLIAAKFAKRQLNKWFAFAGRRV